MAVTGDLYGNAILQAFTGKINFTSDTIKVALLTSSYTPNFGTNVHWSDVSTFETSGAGYTAGGATLASPTATFTAANSWATAAATSTGYSVGNIVRPSTGNGYLYRCVVAGTSGASAPSWPTVVGETVTDGTVTWTNIGTGVVQLGGANPSWSSSTISAQYAVVYDSTPGTASTDPLIACINFGSTVSSTSGTFSITLDPLGIAVFSSS